MFFIQFFIQLFCILAMGWVLLGIGHTCYGHSLPGYFPDWRFSYCVHQQVYEVHCLALT